MYINTHSTVATEGRQKASLLLLKSFTLLTKPEPPHEGISALEKTERDDLRRQRVNNTGDVCTAD